MVLSPYGEEILANQTVKYTVSTATSTGFIVKLNEPALVDLTFSWHAFASPEAKLFVSDGQTEDISLIIIADTLTTEPDDSAPATSTQPSANETSDSLPVADNGVDLIGEAAASSTAKNAIESGASSAGESTVAEPVTESAISAPAAEPVTQEDTDNTENILEQPTEGQPTGELETSSVEPLAPTEPELPAENL